VTTNPYGFVGYGTKPLLGRLCFPDFDKLPAEFDRASFDNIVGSFGVDDIESIYEDLIDAKMIYLYCFLTCFVVTIIYNIILRFFAKILVWVSIILTGTCLIVGSIVLTKYHKDTYSQTLPDGTQKYSESMGKIIKVSCYVLYGLTAIYWCAILCMFNNIRISIAVLQTAAVIVIRNIRILIVPLISIVVTLGFIVLWLVGFGYVLAQANVYTRTDTNTQIKDINLNGKDQVKW
jgi:hypothetical protein